MHFLLTIQNLCDIFPLCEGIGDQNSLLPCYLVCGMQIKDAISRYISKCRADNITPECIKDKERQLGFFDVFCKKEIERVTIEDVYSFINQLKCSENSVWRIKVDLKVFFRFLSENNLSKIPFSLISTKRPYDNIRPDLTEEEFNRIDEECHKLLSVGREYYRWHTIIHFLWETGLRRHELLTLRKQDVDFTAKTFTVMTAKAHYRRRGYFVSDLLPYVYRFKPKDKLFEMSKRQVMYCIEVLARKAHIEKHITTHCFRHGYCTRLLKNGMDIQTTSKLLGHRKLDTTMRYWHNSDIELRNSYEQFISAPKSFEFSSKIGRKQKYKVELKITKNIG